MPQRKMGPFSWASSEAGRLGVKKDKGSAVEETSTPVVDLKNLQNRAVMVVGDSWERMQEYNAAQPPQLRISQFARVLPSTPPATMPSPLIPVQFFVQNSVDPEQRYHEGKPIYVRTPTEQQPHDTLPLKDLRPITAVYQRPLTAINARVLVNTLQQRLSVRLCALEDQDWFACKGCSGEEAEEARYRTDEEHEKAVDKMLIDMSGSLVNNSVRYCHFHCPNPENQLSPECGSFTVVALRDKNFTRYLLLPSDNDLEYKIFILQRFNLPTTLDAIHAINWDRVPLYQDLRKAAVNQPTPCGPPRDGAYMRNIVSELVRRGYTCQCYYPSNLTNETKRFLFERAQLEYP